MNQLDTVSGKVVLSNDNESMIQLSQRMLVEVALNILFYY